MSAAAKDAELYLRRCRKLEQVIADLLMALETIQGPADSGPWIDIYRVAGGGYEGLQAIARAAIAKNRAEL
jgi:hypothetical protein